MNLAESMKYVLKNKGQLLLSDMLMQNIQSVLEKRKKINEFSAKESFQDIVQTIQTTLLIAKALPQRINEGMRQFTIEFFQEMEQLNDPYQRTKFSMKVLAGLSKFALSSAYDLGANDLKLIGLGKNKVLSRLVVSRYIFKSIQGFLVSFISEMEKEITNPDELKFIRGFKETILDDKGNAIDKFFDGVIDPEDKAFKIVENLKNYILTGETK